MMRKITALLSRAASAFGRDRLLVLTFHRVLAQRDPLLPDVPDREQFDWQMRVLREWFTPLALRTAISLMQENALPAGAVAVTFDDGYADNQQVAWPILSRFSVPATFFISTGFLDGGRMFNDSVIEAVRLAPGEQLSAPWLDLEPLPIATLEQRRQAINLLIDRLKYQPPQRRQELCVRLAELARADLPRDLMMTSAQVQALAAAGAEIGAHTCQHYILAEVDERVARDEINASKERLESLVGEQVKAFAYPNGRPGRDYRSEHVHMVRDAGFELAVSTAWGRADRHSDILQIPRVAALGASPVEFALRLAKSFGARASEAVAPQPG